MCDPATIAVGLSTLVGGGVQASGAHQERKAAKSKARGVEKAATEKLVADKEARVTKQENVATGQIQGVDAANTLKALGKTTDTGASQTLGAGNVQKKELIGG